MCSSNDEKLELLNSNKFCQNVEILIDKQSRIVKSRSMIEDENENKNKAYVFIPNTAEANVNLSSGDSNLLNKNVEHILVNGIINPSQTIASNWSRLIDYFQIRISNIFLKLMKVEKSVIAVDQKLENIRELTENASIIKTQFQETLEAYRNDITNLENKHCQQLLEFEDHLMFELKRTENYYKTKNVALKIIYDNNLQEIIQNYEERLSVQNAEIDRLNSIIEEEFNRLRLEVRKLQSYSKKSESENLDLLKRKISILRACLLKKDQEHIISEKAYIKRFSALIRQHELREKSLQIKLATQRAEFIFQNQKGPLDNNDSILTEIENRYQNLLVEQRALFIEQHKKDMETIAQLAKQINS